MAILFLLKILVQVVHKISRTLAPYQYWEDFFCHPVLTPNWPGNRDVQQLYATLKQNLSHKEMSQKPRKELCDFYWIDSILLNIPLASIRLKQRSFNVTQNIFCEISLARVRQKYHVPGIVIKGGLSFFIFLFYIATNLPTFSL